MKSSEEKKFIHDRDFCKKRKLYINKSECIESKCPYLGKVLLTGLYCNYSNS